ncbi:hypothetical protein ACFWIW_06410 [Amycolatopsis sp. NPDC058340]|uniref:hypothetical protein n=1 Tax=Amycolatopsis sp. NPDC058340 TaxID=3346453 RepID=UPI0036484630
MAAPNFAKPRKPLSPAANLDGGVVLRPFEALHELSYVTAPRYQDDVLDVYLQWGLMRYLGFFDVLNTGRPRPRLRLSDAGRRVTGNQRRVSSEEIGIAFGACLARRWFGRSGPTREPIAIVDVDAALDDRYIFAGGVRHTVRKAGAERPDYILIGQDASDHGKYRIRTLECKGTKTLGNAVRQLAKAVQQLDGIDVGGTIPQGLATSVISADSEISYLAIDPAEPDEPSYQVSSDTIGRIRRFRMTEGTSVPTSLEFVNAAVSASWATLADFGGNLGGLERWAPDVMRNRLVRSSRERIAFDTPFGVARGISITFGFAGQQLTIRRMIDEVVDRHLGQGRAEDIMESQGAFAERLERSESVTALDEDQELYSATTDGSVFSLSLR